MVFSMESGISRANVVMEECFACCAARSIANVVAVHPSLADRGHRGGGPG